MSPQRRALDDPAEWLNRAKSNLQRAKADIRLAGIYLEDLCFDAQQAAEKAIKAVLLHLEVRFRHVHDLGQLLTLIQEQGESLPARVKEAPRLTRFAVEARYPGLAEPVSRDEYERATEIAEAVIKWAEARIQEKPQLPRNARG